MESGHLDPVRPVRLVGKGSLTEGSWHLKVLHTSFGHT